MTTLQGDILWSDTQHVDKKTIIGAKVTISGKGRILEHCISLTCTVSDYFKTLIEKDMARAAEGNIMRIRVEGDKIMLTCIHCGGPVPFSLADLGLTRA